jgi:hypothetical protein
MYFPDWQKYVPDNWIMAIEKSFKIKDPEKRILHCIDKTFLSSVLFFFVRKI